MACPAQAQAWTGQINVVFVLLALIFHFSNQLLQYF